MSFYPKPFCIFGTKINFIKLKIKYFWNINIESREEQSRCNKPKQLGRGRFESYRSFLIVCINRFLK